MTALISLLLIAGLLTGCGAAPGAELAEEALAAVSTHMDIPAEETLRYTVELDTWTDSAQAEDGTVLAEYVFELPVMTVRHENGVVVEEARTDGERQALETAAAFNARFQKWAAAEDFAEIVRSAEADYLWCRDQDASWFTPYALDLRCSVYQTERLVSVCGTYYSNTGGVHPNTVLLSWNFDLTAGAFFEPEVLTLDSAGLQDAVVEELLRQAEARALDSGLQPSDFFWESYEMVLEDWCSYAVSFDESGMTVAYSPYELAAYAAGAQEFHLSYEWLWPHLCSHSRLLLGLEE